MSQRRVLWLVSVLAVTVGAAAVLWPSPEPASAASFTVNSTADAVDANPGDGLCASVGGECTLRAGIMETNALPGADTITLGAGVYALTIPGGNEDASATGDLDIADHLTITGAGADSTVVDGGGLDRVFDITYVTYQPNFNATVDISGVTIRNGNAAVFLEQGDYGYGGGVRNRGSLTLNNATVADNVAVEGGGGISNGGTLTLATVNVSGNTAAGGHGGGISSNGTLTATDSSISGNTATSIDLGGYGQGGCGGGIDNDIYAQMTLTRVTVSDNTAVCGGGIFSASPAALTNVTVSGNRAVTASWQINSGMGGGITTTAGGQPLSVGRVTATNVTITGNTAAREHSFGSGGGINIAGVT